MNMNRMVIHVLALVFQVASTAVVSAAELKMPSIFADHMVLQRDAKVPVWGWADAGAEVTVEFSDQKKTVKADRTGKWMVKLDPMKANREPQVMTIVSSNLQFANVLVGEVWLAAGQSNMEMGLLGAHNATTAIPAAKDAQLRFFSVARNAAADPQPDVCGGKWEVCTPESAKGFSAVGYFFARELRATLQCPVAIILSSWRGTTAQVWLSIPALRLDPPFADCLKTWEDAFARHQEVLAHPELAENYRKDLENWRKELKLFWAEQMPAHKAAMKKYADEKSSGPKRLAYDMGAGRVSVSYRAASRLWSAKYAG